MAGATCPYKGVRPFGNLDGHCQQPAPAQAPKMMIRSPQNTRRSAGTDSPAEGRGQSKSDGVSRRIHGYGGAQSWGEGPRPLRVCPRGRVARRARDSGQDPSRHPARPADQGGLYRRDRGRQARGLSRTRASSPAMCAPTPGTSRSTRTRSSGASARRAASPARQGGQAQTQGARVRARRSRWPAASGRTFRWRGWTSAAGCRRSRCRRSARSSCSSALIAGLGYGGWTVLQSIQRVQFAPVEELPLAVAEMDPLDPPEATPLEEPTLTELASPVAATALADLYRQQEAEVPILVPARRPDRRARPGQDRAPGAGRAVDGDGGQDRGRAGIEVPAALIEAAAPPRTRARTPGPPVAATPDAHRRWSSSPSAPPGSGSTRRTARSSSRASWRRDRPIRRPTASRSR